MIGHINTTSVPRRVLAAVLVTSLRLKDWPSHSLSIFNDLLVTQQLLSNKVCHFPGANEKLANISDGEIYSGAELTS